MGASERNFKKKPTSHPTLVQTLHPYSTPQLRKHINVDMIKEDHLGSYLNQETESQYIHRALDNYAIY